MSTEDTGRGWEAMGRIATGSGYAAFADVNVLGEGFRIRSDLLVANGTVDGLDGSIVMHAAPADTPFLVERYFGDRNTVTAARICLGVDYDTAEAAGEWEEIGGLSLMLGVCAAADPRNPGELHRLPFTVQRGRYSVERLVVPADSGTTVAALRVRIQGQRKPSSERRP